MNEIRQRLPRTREKRRGALTAYYGDCAALADELEQEEPRQRIRTYSETDADEVTFAIRLLGRIRGSVTIIHSPPGCGAIKLEDELKAGGSPWLITNIEENDSILGADDKLREAVDLAYRTWRPEIIFILTTPVVAINNDDILSAATEKEDLYNIPVVPVFAAGFRSRTAVYGYDLVFHALAKYVLKGDPGASPIPAVNLIGAAETRTGNIIKDLNGAGVSYNNVLGSISISALQQSLGASASIAIDQDDARFLLEWLEAAHGVVHLEETAPIGLAGTERWLLAAAGAGGSTGQARAYIEEEKAAAAQALERQRLDGVSVIVDLPPEQAFGIAEFVEELGGVVVALSLTHADISHGPRLREWASRSNPQVYIQPGQPFEKTNALGKLKPALYIGKGEAAVWAARAGIAAAAVDSVDLYGFGGVQELAPLFAKALRNSALSRYLSAGGSSYRAGWLSKSANWHIKQEVK
ncbi:nitrogenase component 1 [Paenibacillus durus]|uniref:Nitrogenase/oxidoreductase component 1 domain-containing protein n=1 Tax=Paenibacillus durus ATCC 35681 TaxID=1333534 RepID=A0A0F7FD66_PAEDU|nr:nitrogenase component 1 [Paenibacillus durus]AKG36390.1 hypothetical protein VK70_19090 [Paenibacillus durus ATCC 35681]